MVELQWKQNFFKKVEKNLEDNNMKEFFKKGVVEQLAQNLENE
jgi:hypothetical protein